jgi:hypothetical protein
VLNNGLVVGFGFFSASQSRHSTEYFLQQLARERNNLRMSPQENAHGCGEACSYCILEVASRDGERRREQTDHHALLLLLGAAFGDQEIL